MAFYMQEPNRTALMENNLLKELLEIKQKEQREHEFHDFGETEPGYPGEETRQGIAKSR